MSLYPLTSLLALILAAGSLSAQSENKGCIEDLNADGIIDTLAFASDPDPCGYPYLVTFTDGKTGEKISVPREEYCRCHIRSVVPIPPALWLGKGGFSFIFGEGTENVARTLKLV